MKRLLQFSLIVFSFALFGIGINLMSASEATPAPT